MINDNESLSLSYTDKVAIKEYEKISSRLIYEIIRKNGIEELVRSNRSLIFSGITAGIIISFSFLFKAIFTACLPNTNWANLINNLGYSVGFLLVILGNLQLFTENTITTVVPMFNPLTFKKVLSVIRLWTIVLIANLIGTTLAALFLQNKNVLNQEFIHELNKIALHIKSFSIQQNLWRGIPSGILIASLVWILPIAKKYAFILILFITYLISLGDFTHIVVGSSEMMYLVFQNQASLYDYFCKFAIPTCLGNIIGGTIVFTILIYIQVTGEISNR